jgi:hypothetical protein
VRVVAPTHPLTGQVLRARHVYRRYARLWLVLVLADGGVTSVPVEHTDVLAIEPVVAPRVGETTVSIDGARRLLGLLAALLERAAQDAARPPQS